MMAARSSVMLSTVIYSTAQSPITTCVYLETPYTCCPHAFGLRSIGEMRTLCGG